MADHVRTDFSDLPGWDQHDHKAAFAAFRASAPHLLANPPKERPGSARTDALLAVARAALSVPESVTSAEARAFFEARFIPLRINQPGLLTGYYEPVFEGRHQPDARFCIPIHARPADLVSLSTEEAVRAGFTPETSFARKTDSGYSFHHARGEVMDGALDGAGLELVWLADPFEAFTIHIQGSARIRMENGSTMRIAFDGKSGHPYRSLGKLLIEQGVFTPETISMDAMIAHLRGRGADGIAMLAENPSYIFFKSVPPLNGQHEDCGPAAAAGIPLVPLRSIAVDRHVHTFGLPFWIESSLPAEAKAEKDLIFQQLVFAHDTGSAIKGAARGDLFTGTGPDAGRLAGALQQSTRFTCLMPRTDTTDGSDELAKTTMRQEADLGEETAS